MIDIHSHILPDLDDGAQSLHESIEMARAAYADGIRTIVATPHHANGKYHNDANTIIQAVELLNQQLGRERIGVQIMAGQEIRVYRGMLDDLDRLQTLHYSSYMLIEFPSGEIPGYVPDLIYELKLLGVIPIIAHPERNLAIAKSPGQLLRLIELGALSQVTSHSITGLFGRTIQALSLKLCENHLAHFISTDAHDVSRRPFALKQAYAHIEAKLGAGYVDYFQDNAERVVENRTISTRQPVWPRHKWYQFWKSS